MLRARGRLVLASYNVHRCVGVDGRRDPARIARVIRELEADVVALQEVDGGDDPDDPLGTVARAAGYAVFAGPTLERDDTPYGNAVLTRLPARRLARHDLSVAGREPRGAIELAVQGPAGGLRLVATHLGLGRRERRAQIRRLLALVESAPDGPLALLGDMNEWLPLGRSLGSLQRRLGACPALPTFPARRPLLALDRIWVLPASAVVRRSVHRSPLARRASDHLPVVAELALGPEPPRPEVRPAAAA
jgi:endonuclease/exonuclease/phosphatase family metal-dependent hydrolase